jgi:dihydroorotate dehydrogenase/Pyruvate/2-oxoacid:ferredoxin oxidoreductase delta subunit
MLEVVADAGAGGLLAKTVSVRAAPVPRPHMAQYGRAGMLNTELWTELTLEQWIEEEYDVGIAAAREHGVPFIASMGYTAGDLRVVAPQVAKKDVDAIEFSIHYVGTDFSDVIDTARTLRELVEVPIIAKLSPHFGDLGDLAEVLAPHVDAFTCINSFGPTLAIDIERAEPVMGSKLGYGWMSGEPIKPIALRCVFEVARRVDKPVIGVGGICRGEDLIEFFMAGASLVGICTAAIYQGADIYRRVSDEAAAWLDAHGYTSVSDVQGQFLDRYRDGQRVVVEKEEAPQLVEDRCIGCTRCDQVCLYDAIEAPPWESPRITEASCFQCGLCVSACPTDALHFRPRAGVTLGAS